MNTTTIAQFESATKIANYVSQQLEEQKLPGEHWTVSIWTREEGKYTIWFQIEIRQGNNAVRSTSKIIDPTYYTGAYFPLSLVENDIYDSFHKLRNIYSNISYPDQKRYLTKEEVSKLPE